MGNHSLLHDEIRGVDKGEEESREEEPEYRLVHGAKNERKDQKGKVFRGVHSLEKMRTKSIREKR